MHWLWICVSTKIPCTWNKRVGEWKVPFLHRRLKEEMFLAACGRCDQSPFVFCSILRYHTAVQDIHGGPRVGYSNIHKFRRQGSIVGMARAYQMWPAWICAACNENTSSKSAINFNAANFKRNPTKACFKLFFIIIITATLLFALVIQHLPETRGNLVGEGS